MPHHDEPVFRTLTTSEAEALLARNQMGRLAYSLHDHVDVEPLNYVYDAPWIFGRTSVGAKLIALAHNRWCAFEVDEVGGLFEWQSVVVKGPFYALNSELGKAEEYDRAVIALRQLSPNAFADKDPAPHRAVVWGVHASEIEGRSAAAGGAFVGAGAEATRSRHSRGGS